MVFLRSALNEVHSYFLTGYNQASYFERKKATYLYYIILSALAFICFVLVGQAYFKVGSIYLVGNLIALNGVVFALSLFKKRKTDTAGHVMAGSLITMVFLHNVVRDMFDSDPAMRYRIYIDMASLMGIYFILVSFFREKRIIFYYGMAFMAVLMAHTVVIFNSIGHLPNMKLWIFEHFVTVWGGVIAIGFIMNWLLEYVNALLDQNGEYSRLIKSQNDRLEVMVTERTKALTRSNDSLKEFAYIVSHDLKEPLRTISGFMTLLNKELDKHGLLEDEIAEYISYTKGGTRQMEKLISDILAYSKLNVDEKKADDVSIEDVIKEVKTALAKSIYESEAEIVFLDTVNVTAEKRLVVQLFQNLISNAIKYRQADRQLQIIVGCEPQSDDMVCYFVKDNGIGIAHQYFDTIFQAFKRLHSKVDYEGTGVGLAICKKIVEINGGQIWVESAEGEGSTFYFTLPRCYKHVPAINPVVHAA